MNLDFTLGNVISLIVAIGAGLGVLFRMRLDLNDARQEAASKLNAIKIQHDAEIKALEKDIAELKRDQHEMAETAKAIYGAIAAMKDQLGNAFNDLRDRLTRIEAQHNIPRRRQQDKA